MYSGWEHDVMSYFFVCVAWRVVDMCLVVRPSRNHQCVPFQDWRCWLFNRRLCGISPVPGQFKGHRMHKINQRYFCVDKNVIRCQWHKSGDVQWLLVLPEQKTFDPFLDEAGYDVSRHTVVVWHWAVRFADQTQLRSRFIIMTEARRRHWRSSSGRELCAKISQRRAWMAASA